MKKTYRIAPEIKADILRRIKDEWLTVAQAAEQHGISPKTIYGRLKVSLGDTNRFTSLGELILGDVTGTIPASICYTKSLRKGVRRKGVLTRGMRPTPWAALRAAHNLASKRPSSFIMVRMGRIELPTTTLSVWCSTTELHARSHQ